MAEPATRLDWTQLEIVRDGDLVFRFVQPKDYNAQAPHGARVQPSALTTAEFTPNEKSYGASVYVKSRLARGITDLYDACPKWKTWHIAEIPVAIIIELGLEARFSPQDCPFEQIRHAHGSLLGVTRPIRNKLIRLMEHHLLDVRES